jgi:F0F1-type ATP synthase membrane subunit b/b'
MKRDAERLVGQERKQLAQELQTEAVELSIVEATAVLAKSITPEDHARLAHDLLAELTRRPSAASATSAKSAGGAS